MAGKTTNRRAFLGATLGAAGAAAFLVACGKGGGDAAAGFKCTDTKGLTDPEKTVRASLAYSDKATDKTKTCVGCELYKVAAAGSCGTCTSVKGPIHPDGTCSAWVAKIA